MINDPDALGLKVWVTPSGKKKPKPQNKTTTTTTIKKKLADTLAEKI